MRRSGTTPRRASRRSRKNSPRAPDAVPSDFVPPQKAREYAAFVQRRFHEADVMRFGVRVHGAGEYPQKLRDAAHPVELLYYQGWWDLVESRLVAVVGTRTPTPDGIARTRRLVRELVRDDFTVVSGLAAGIDTIAHETAIAEGGRTIAVIGTPLSHSYPKDNAELQRKIADRIPAHQPSACTALRQARLPQKSFFLPRTQHHNVGVDGSDRHC